MTEVRGQKSDSGRRRLPDRRPVETTTVVHENQSVFASVGFEPETMDVLEVWMRGCGPPGSDMDLLLDDIGVLISRLFQHGEDPADLASGLGRVAADPAIAEAATARPASIIGAVADWLAYVAAEDRSQGSEIGDQNGHPPLIPDPCRLTSDPDDLEDFKPGGTD